MCKTTGVTFDRTVKFQFSDGDVEFDLITVNGVDAGCLELMMYWLYR